MPASKGQNDVFNGQIYGPDICINYKGYEIRPKLDMGRTPWLVNGRKVDSGFVVVRNLIQVMPGAIWFETVESAHKAIDALIAVNGNVDAFWKAYKRI